MASAFRRLPRPLTSFVGRETDVAELSALVPTSRLVSLTGPGGAGKTRLALEVASRLSAHFDGGTSVVDLAPLTDAGQLIPQIASTLGVREEPGQTVDAALTEHLLGQRVLLVLDNVEHLVDVCADSVQRLLVGCPDLYVIVTSREPLALAGEVVWPVVGLTAPRDDAPRTLGALRAYDACRLFIERTRALNPRVGLDDLSGALVARICRRLDGLPLAIELAAARTPVLSLEEIDARLDDRFRLLRSSHRVVQDRHQTLRAVVDWSYDQLTEPERAIFLRLAVFADGASLESAEAIYAAEPELPSVAVIDVLGTLARKSMITVEARTGGATRYRLLETMRAYALDRLRERNELEVVRARHAVHLAAGAEAMEAAMWAGDQNGWLSWCDLERDNLRVALDWSLEGGDAVVGLRAAAAVWRHWSMRGRLSEGRGWLDRLLAAPAGAPDAVRAKALTASGTLAQQHGDHEAARRAYEESLAIRRRLEDLRGVANSLNGLGNVASAQGDLGRADTLLRQSLEIRRRLDDDWGIAACLNNLGLIKHQLGELDTARGLYAESLDIERRLQNRQGEAYSLSNLGLVARDQGCHGDARRLLTEALMLQRELGDVWGIANTLHNLGDVATAEGELDEGRACYAEALERWRQLDDTSCLVELLESVAGWALATRRPSDALRVAGAAARARADLVKPLSAFERERLDRVLAGGTQLLARRACDEAFDEGKRLGLDPALDIARSVLTGVTATTPPPARPEGSDLTRRELEIATLVARGLTNRQIGLRLFISERTVETHVANVRAKLQLEGRAQIGAWAAQQGLLDPAGRF